MVREVLAWRLIAQGYRVTQASDGLAALAQLESGNIPDLLVTDFAMPGMNGLVLIQEARRHRPKLPALLLTGYADGNIVDDVLNTNLDPISLCASRYHILRLASAMPLLPTGCVFSVRCFGAAGDGTATDSGAINKAIAAARAAGSGTVLVPAGIRTAPLGAPDASNGCLPFAGRESSFTSRTTDPSYPRDSSAPRNARTPR